MDTTQIITLILAGAGGALATFALQRYGISAVVASCLIGLTGAGIGFLVSDAHIPAVVFAGSFVGMTALHLASLPLILATGAVAGVLYVITLDIFPGYGGRLGTIAFIASVFCIWLLALLHEKITHF